jgi:DNA-binding NtrC family response regulator
MNENEIEQIKKKYGIVGNYSGLNQAVNVALQVAKTDLSVLITGESGVGKEILPRIIHDNSSRRNKKYFAVNCGSIPEGTIDSELFGHEKGAFTGAISEREGYFGVANGGTLFLDEVGELPMATQARLLRVLETGEYIRVGSSEVRKTDVRIVAATNVNIGEAISEGKFREDLYYRLNTIPIKMPALRERGRDIELLFRKFALATADKYKMDEPVHLTEEAKAELLSYPWPGNVRQLKNLTEQISILSTTKEITAEVLEHYIPPVRSSNQLITLKNSEPTHSFESEREILYQILFDLRRDVTDLKKLVHSNMVSSSPAVTPSQSTPVAYYPNPSESSVPTTINVAPLNRSHVASAPSQEEIADADEYVEESLSLGDLKRQTILRALEKNRGRRKNAAAELGISERTLYRKIKEYGLE